MSVLEILLYEEPCGQGSEDDSNEGHRVGGDKGSYSGVGDSEVGQGLVDKLCSDEISISIIQYPPIPNTTYLDHVQQHQLLHRDGTEGGVFVRCDSHVGLADWQFLELQIEGDVHPHPAL